MRKELCCIIIFLAFACKNSPDKVSSAKSDEQTMQFLSYKVLQTYPHDTASFTEGLFWNNGLLYESTGYEEKTSIRKIDIEKHTVVSSIKEKDKALFGEGITLLNGDIYQLTWRNRIVNVYNEKDLIRNKQMRWPLNEGWGLTNNGKQLIASDGSSKIYFINPETMQVVSSLNVSDNYGFVANINELEFVGGYIYANVWQTNYIVKINATSGKVEAKLDLSGIMEKAGVQYDPSKIDVLNGIAYNHTNKHFYITGKYWPTIIEIDIH